MNVFEFCVLENWEMPVGIELAGFGCKLTWLQLGEGDLARVIAKINTKLEVGVLIMRFTRFSHFISV